MKKTITLTLSLVFVIALIITQTGCSGKTEPVSKTSYYMDTICEITIYDMDDMSQDAAASVIDDAFSLCADLEGLISMTKEESDIYKVNHAKGTPVKCSPETIEVVKMGIDYGDLSEGLFDITIGKVSDLWDFHGEGKKLPDRSAVKAALDDVDYKTIHISGNTITMANPKAEINLGGIGKGFVADKAAAKLQELGVTSAIVNFGGNIVTIGDKDGTPFKIGVEQPFSDQNGIIGSVDAKDAVVVTSGTYERYIQVNGKKYHHILDVNTGYPVNTDVTGVSLVGKIGNSAQCDALSTICLILGVDDGLKLIENTPGVEAVFIDKDGKTHTSSGMKFDKI
ncbi:MAG: FAD:protein FMN transferase [Clostridia bacterium]|nr:FAD:protein FMN transferase [Clostridia bacterium]